MLTLNDGRSELWQWDTGRKLTVDADCSQVHFSNKVFGRSIDVDVVDGVAIIPDVLLQTDKDLTAWAFVGTPEDGYTKISKSFKVNKRNKPADYVFTPPEQTTLAGLVDRLNKIEENQDPDAIKNAVEDYLEQNPVEAPVKSVNGVSPDKNGNVEIEAGGLSTTAVNLLIEILRNGVYSTDQSANITALAKALASSGDTGGDEPVVPDEPDIPDEPEVTLSSISATYSGGNVPVGTSVTALTGVVVKARYSDGSTATVTDYTLSGEIVEGSNTITVSYGGKTTTFTVTGVAESDGDSGDGVSSINWLLKNDKYGTDYQHDTWGDMAVEPDNGYLVKTTAADGLTGTSADKACAVWPLMAGETYNIVITNSTENNTFFNIFSGTLNETPVKGTISTVEGTRTKSIAAFVNCPALGTNTYTHTAGNDEWLFIVPNNANRLTITAEVTT